MKKILLIITIFFVTVFHVSSSYAENLRFGVEGGFTWADMRAEETAQTLANLSGSTVTYTYDEATWMGRVFADYELSTEMSLEVGFFFTGSLDANYTISGSSATEGYTAQGVDVAAVFKQDEIFLKAGMHSSELEGDASLTIGGTTYSISDTISGTGYLVGAGLEMDDNRAGVTYYADVGGDADSDMVFLYYGVLF
tara:strand:+ start:285 stop:872 length:588 start_codon:yes stop_codon:yes gene_type:complete